MKNIWQELKSKNKPFSILAPMEDVTDTVFRQLINSLGRPDLFYTEFTNCEGLMSDGSARVGQRLLFTEVEKPLIAQVWGITPEDYFKSARHIVDLGFDGLDINMGCPVKKVIKQGACSALIKNQSLAKEIVEATKQGLAGKIPLSIKTRIGFSKVETLEWTKFLMLECKPEALIIHGRTVKEESKVPCRWDEIAKVSKLRSELGLESEVVLIGNGDINSYQQGLDFCHEYNLDGFMVGRGIFENPWFFDPSIDPASFDLDARLDILTSHVGLYQKQWENKKPFANLKKYIKIYLCGIPNSASYRKDLMESVDYEDLLNRIKELKSRADIFEKSGLDFDN